MTFTEIVTQVSEDLNLQGNTGAITRIGRQVNIRYKRIVSSLGIDTSKRTSSMQNPTVGSTEITFTSIDKVTRIADVTGGDVRLLKEVTWDELREESPPDSDSPTRYAIKRMNANSVVVTFDVNFQTTTPSMRADGYQVTSTLSGVNEPAFPEDFHDILVWGAKADELLKMEKVKLYEHAEAMFRNRLSELRLFLAKSNYLDVRQGARAASDTGSAGGGGSSSATQGESNYTQTGLITFDRDPAAPFAVTDGSEYVPNLYAEGVGNVTTDRLIGRDTAGTGESEQLTVGGGVEFTGSGGIQTSALTGDVTKAAGGVATTIANDAVTYAKMQNVSAASKLVGRGSASGAGDPEEITVGEALTMSATTLRVSEAVTGPLNALMYQAF